MKRFNTNNMQIIESCFQQLNFYFFLPSRQIANRRDKCIKSDSERTNLLSLTCRHYCYAAYIGLVTNLDKYMLICLCFLSFLFYFQLRYYHLWRIKAYQK